MADYFSKCSDSINAVELSRTINHRYLVHKAKVR